MNVKHKKSSLLKYVFNRLYTKPFMDTSSVLKKQMFLTIMDKTATIMRRNSGNYATIKRSFEVIQYTVNKS